MNAPREIPLTIDSAERDAGGNEILINIEPEISETGKYPFVLVHTPGRGRFHELPTFPVMGLHSIGLRAFAFTPSKVYEVFTDGTFLERGDVDLSGVLSIADNGLEMVVVDGYKGFYLTLSTNVVQQITSPAFYPAAGVTFQDTLFIFDRKDTGEFFYSRPYSVIFNANDYAEEITLPDNTERVISHNRELFIFGTKGCAVWFNSGNSDFTFERNNSVFIEKGTAARYTIAQQDDTIYFVGDDRMVYAMDGYTPRRVSTHLIESYLLDADLSDAFAYTYETNGKFYYSLTIPAHNVTWVYEKKGFWVKRESYQFGRDLTSCIMFYDNKWVVGDFQNGFTYQLTDKIFHDNGEPQVRKFKLPKVDGGQQYMSIGSFQLIMDVGVGRGVILNSTSATDITANDLPGQDPKYQLRYSKDDGRTWSNPRTGNIGKAGEFSNRAKINRFGSARHFDFEVTISDPVPVKIVAAFIETQ